MSMRPMLVASALLLLACAADPSAPREDTVATDEERVAWLIANSVPVRSVDAADVDFSDLEPLRAAIGDARVVMLGEETHGDGTAFEAKVRLIKFLHAEMGFDIIAFEAGLFDVREAWTRIRAGNEPVESVRSSIFGIWSRAEEVRPLFEYIAAHANSQQPLELTGIDPQFTGPVGAGTGAFFLDALEAHLQAHSSPLLVAPRWFAFREIASRIALQYYRDTDPTISELADFDEVIAQLRVETARILAVSPSFTSSYWNQLADALEAQGRAWWARAASPTGFSIEYSILRDASMARNLAWTLESGYPGRKVIVWAHSGHILSSGHAVRLASGDLAFHPDYRTLGDLARESYLDDIYTIGFLAGGGSFGFAAVQTGTAPPPVNIAAPTEGSWEDLLMQVGPAHLFLDLRQSRQGLGAWVRDARLAGPLFYAPMTASWPRVFDALFFSRHMAPATPVQGR